MINRYFSMIHHLTSIIVKFSTGLNHTLFGGIISILLGINLNLSGQELPAPAQEIPLYKGAAPGSEDWDWQKNTAITTTGLPMVQNVVRPVLLYYSPDPSKALETAMIVAPGGGTVTLMMSYEGVDIARRLNEMGVHAFILKYRLIHVDLENPDTRPKNYKKGMGFMGKQAGQNVRDLAAADGQQAVRLLRSQAPEFNIAPDRIGIMGFSAGGRVTVATLIGPEDARPDFAAPIYAPAGKKYDLPIHVPEDAPPLFIATAADDQIIPWTCATELFAAWRKAGYPAELHVFQAGRHGFVDKGGGADHFMDRLEEWLRVNRFLEK
jgi:acetyl esterase/lipase